MVPSQIEKEIVIEAPIDDVWRALTDPAQITQWFASECELDEQQGRLTFESGETYYLQVEAFEPPRRFAYRWLHEKNSKARPDNSMLVEFILEPGAGHTRLRLIESGFEHVDWSDEAKTKYFDDHSRGWGRFVERLREYAQR